MDKASRTQFEGGSRKGAGREAPSRRAAGRAAAGPKAVGRILLALAASLLIASCATKPPVLSADASAAEIIQKAQERSDLYDWKGAKYCYQLLLERFPQDRGIVVTAMYELAYIEYKQGHKAIAAEGFKAVIAAYSTEGGENLPATWKILSEKLLAKLEPQTPAKK